jgi:glutathione S-transferase
MRLYVTRPSPYARKAWAAVLELGLAERVEIIELPARMPAVPKPDLDAVNPLGKVPALITDEGDLIADSPVILAFLNELAGGHLIPSGPERWRSLTLQALADGCMDAGVVIRVEQLKDEARRDQPDIDAHRAKIGRALDLIESDGSWLAGGFDVGALALACAIEWLIFREILSDPLAGRPQLAAWSAEMRERPALLPNRPA